MARGDCTVPEISAMRQSNAGNYLGPATPKVFDNVDHGGLPNDMRVISALKCIFNGQSGCLNLSNNAMAQTPTAPTDETPVYHLKILGSSMVTIKDSFGNTSSPFSTSEDEGVATVSTTVTGADSMTSIIPLDQSYQVLIKTSSSPLVISVIKIEGSVTTQAVRYLDISTPPNVQALLELTPQGVTLLKYDSDGDGTFDVTVQPTISVIGSSAQDTTPPNVTITSTSQGSSALVTISAADSESGVKTIYFSQDGVNFKVYAGSFAVDSSQGPAVFAFADDNVANRSSVVAYYPASTTNQVDNAQFFVHQHYLDFLNREPDSSGLGFWTNQMTSCGNEAQCVEVHRINVSAAFFLSIEFQQTGYLVERIYKSAYGDATGTSTIGGTHQLPVPIVRFDEFLRDTQRIGQGVIVLAPGWEQLLETNKQVFVSEFVQRTRFTDAYPTSMTPEQFVDKLNQNAGNVLSSTERTTAINLFGGAADTNNVSARAQAVRQIAEDADLVNAESNRAFVLSEYFGYLRRNPNDAPEPTLDYTGYDFWLTKLNQFSGNYINAEMVKAFLSSSEYRQRFSP
jgi:hypothetical protein